MQLKVNSGKLPVGWKVKKLGDVCKFQGGAQPPKSIFSTICKENYVRLIQIRDYKSDNHVVFIPKDKARRFCTKEDVMIGRYGPPVFQILRGLEGAYNVALMKATPDESQLLKDFLFYFLKTPRVQNYVINLSARAAGQSGLNKETIEPYLIPIPPLPEQERIVAVLDEAFEGIDRAIANTEKNLANSGELFESYLSTIFTQKGNGWVENKLHSVVEPSCSLSYGIVQPGNDYENGLPVVRPTDLTTKTINLSSLKRIDPLLADSYKRTKLTGGELLLCVRGNTGIVGIAADELKGANVTRGIVPITFEKSTVVQAFGYYMLISKMTQDQIKEKTYGAALMQINIRDLKNIVLSFPEQEEQQALVKKLDQVEKETQRLETIYRQKLAALKELKQSILQKAFTGELTADTPKAVKEEIAA